jgi:hypothetical protein
MVASAVRADGDPGRYMFASGYGTGFAARG